nr:helix-turn-helix domain-containing protein [Nonomuraea cypriaca]
MTRSRAQDLNMCGVTAAIAVIDGRWKTILLWALESGPHRPGELRRRLPGLTEKVLTQTLREMEADGLVHREVHDVRPLKTVYIRPLRPAEGAGSAMPLHGQRWRSSPPDQECLKFSDGALQHRVSAACRRPART